MVFGVEQSRGAWPVRCHEGAALVDRLMWKYAGLLLSLLCGGVLVFFFAKVHSNSWTLSAMEFLSAR